MKRIIVHTIPHAQQRYPTVGDWFDAHGLTVFRVSHMENELYERLVFIHEFIEQTLCMHRGIKEWNVDAFDMAYEDNRRAGDDSEPGDSALAPYHAEHCFATAIERRMADELGIDWDHYDKTVSAL
jgi:hypothetical protein